MNKKKWISYASHTIDFEDIECVQKSLTQEAITRGETVKAFEEAIAKFCGASYAVAFNSGSNALMAACFAAKCSSFDRVITTSNSYIATVSAAIQRKAHPFFVDIDTETGNLSADKLFDIMNVSSSRGKEIIIPVHFAGIALDMQKIFSQVKRPSTIIIEDGCHALGSCYPTGEKVGSCRFSDMTVFSFHPAKLITTGEGGMVTTNNVTFYERLKLFRNNCIERGTSDQTNDTIKELSGNFHLTDFQAALGLSQLNRIDKMIKQRRKLLNKYYEVFEDCSHIQPLTSIFDKKRAPTLFVVKIDFEKIKMSKKELINSLKEQGIGTQVHYIPLYRHEVIKNLIGDQRDKFPQMEKYYSQALTLPLHNQLKPRDVKRIALYVKKFTSV